MLRSNNREWNNALDLLIECSLLRIVLFILVRVHANVVEGKLFSDAVLEQLALLKSERVCLRNDWDNVDSLAQLLEYNNVDWSQAVTRWVDEVQAAVDAGVLNISLTLCCQLFSQVC